MSSVDTPPEISRFYEEMKHSNKEMKNVAILRIAFADAIIANRYTEAIENHNYEFLHNIHCDSGFDLFVPEDATFEKVAESKFIDMKVKTEMIYYNVAENTTTPCAYYLYPRSSLSKTQLIMANHVGIIDSGYRGSVIGAFKWIRTTETGKYTIEKGTRLVQICHPLLCPIYIDVVTEEELSTSVRGYNGFGSTGK
jgi:dUTP pyrophosphatase